jgi:ABC-type Zn2+ transport system substrate-binding protein/surface adhesin
MAGDQFMSLYSGIDIFIEKLIRKRADAAEFTFNSMHDLWGALAREESREKSSEDGDAEDHDDGDL